MIPVLRFLRHGFFVLVLLRLVAGSAWAMPSVDIGVLEEHITATASAEAHVPMLCHEEVVNIANDDDSSPPVSGAHASPLCNPLGHACCIGVALAVSALPASTVSLRHTQPTHRARSVARWLHVPDFRPPIDISKN